MLSLQSRAQNKCIQISNNTLKAPTNSIQIKIRIFAIKNSIKSINLIVIGFQSDLKKLHQKTHSNSRTIYKLQKNEHMWQKYIQNSKQIYNRLKIDIDHNKVIEFDILYKF